MSTQLVLTRGYPASGKSTWARGWVAQADGRARVGRDELCAMMFGDADADGLEPDPERGLTAAEHAQVAALLRAGVSVVVDAAHLRARDVNAWAELAAGCGATFAVRDFPTEAEVCVRRDAARGAAGGRTVGAQAIRELAARFPIGRWPAIPATPRAQQAAALPYRPDPALPSAYLVDVDGTLARMTDRSPFDWGRVDLDAPVEAVIGVVRAVARDAAIVVLSGRDEVCRDHTDRWLRRHGVPFELLLMRPRGDGRKDAVVKAELFDKHVRHEYHVLGVFDDRLQVCRMWHRLGLPLFRVGDPDADF